jgi:Kef-type K+ transport system membrane component KefB
MALDLLTLVLQMTVVLGACRLLGDLFLKLGQPRVNGEMFAGILLGPSLLGRFAPSISHYLFPSSGVEFLNALGQVGVILFMFLVGMSINPATLKNQGKAAVAGTLVSIAAPMVLAFGLGKYLYPRVADGSVTFLNFALFLGAATSITAFPMLARILSERSLMASRLGAVAIACAATAGIVTWSILAYILAIIKASGSTFTIALTFAGIVVWAVLMFAAVGRGMRRFEQAFQKAGSLTDGLFAALLMIMLACGVCAGYLGLHPLFGAFMLGVVMPKDTKFVSHVTGRFETVTVSLLLPLYFAFSGLRTDTGLMKGTEMWLFCGVIIVVTIAGKLLFPMLSTWAAGMSLRESAGLGALLNTRGLIALIVFNIGLDLKVITPVVFSMLVIMALVNTLLTLPLLNFFCPSEWYEASGTPASVPTGEGAPAIPEPAAAQTS